MKEIMVWTAAIWNDYWGSGICQYLLLAAVLYLLIWKRKKKSTRQILAYLAVVLFLFLCPVTAVVIQKCIGKEVYWRVLWLVPTTPVIALAGAELLSDLKNKWAGRLGKRLRGVLLAALFVFTVVLCGTTLLRSGVYEKAHNYQKVPDAVAHICNMIREHADGRFVFLAADEHISTYVRVYDPSICMPYGRRMYGALDENSRTLYELMNTGTFEAEDYEAIAAVAKEKRCYYIAVALNENFEESIMTSAGYTQIGQVNQYGIFSLYN